MKSLYNSSLHFLEIGFTNLIFSTASLLTVAIAALSWHLMESPLNELKRHFPYRF